MLINFWQMDFRVKSDKIGHIENEIQIRKEMAQKKTSEYSSKVLKMNQEKITRRNNYKLAKFSNTMDDIQNTKLKAYDNTQGYNPIQNGQNKAQNRKFNSSADPKRPNQIKKVKENEELPKIMRKTYVRASTMTQPNKHLERKQKKAELKPLINEIPSKPLYLDQQVKQKEITAPEKNTLVEERIKLDKKSMIKGVSNYEEWKKKNKIDPGKKVFIVSSAIKDIKEALYRRGWVENPDQTSPFFDFKWAIKSKDIVFNDTSDNQIVNHFSKNTTLTTKSGLAKALSKVNTFHDIDPDHFFPRCYNLEELDQAEDFLIDYKFSYVSYY